LQKNLPPRIENQNMHGAMLQTEPMHLTAALLADHFILFIDNVENLFV